jgi:hypothetical protein
VLIELHRDVLLFEIDFEFVLEIVLDLALVLN